MSTRRGHSLKWQFGLLTLGTLIPTLLFVGVLLWRVAATERQRIEAEARALSSGVAVAVDREIAGVLATLQALGTSPSLHSGDLPAFYAQISEIHRQQSVHISLRSAIEGTTLLTTRAPLGAAVAVPAVLAETDREILRTGKATVSNVFISTTLHQPVFQIVSAPVSVAGRPTYLLAASVDLDYIAETVRREDLPKGWVGALVDRNSVIAARTERQQEYAGKPASDDYRSHVVGRAGSYYGHGPDGRALLAGYAHSAITGWTATTAIDADTVEAPLRHLLLYLTGLGLVLGLIATGIALLVGRRVDGAMAELRSAANAIGQGRVVTLVATPISEANEVGVALANASEQLAERLRQRELAEAEQRHLNDQLALQAADLRESNEEMQRYAYIVSHDLRAPLVNVMGFTSEIEATQGDVRAALAGHARAELIDRDLGEAVCFIKAAVNKMEGLIAAILKLSREGRRIQQPRPLAMTALVQALADAIHHQTEAAGAEITIAHDLPDLTADKLSVEQVLGNLLDNAVKYLSPDRPGRITVGGKAVGERVVYRVSDNGRGIARQDQGRVFELFRRAGVQDRPGDGIGLAHVRAAVKAMGGRIELVSAPGQGSTFTVTLPRIAQAPVAVEDAAA